MHLLILFEADGVALIDKCIYISHHVPVQHWTNHINSFFHYTKAWCTDKELTAETYYL